METHSRAEIPVTPEDMLPESLSQVLFRTAPQGILFQDGEGAVLSANAAAERILGLSLERMQGRTSMEPGWDAIHPDGSPFPGESHPAIMNMPGLGGIGTLPRLRALCPALPILLATGRIDQAALDLTRVHPLVTLLSKPFSMGELRQHL